MNKSRQIQDDEPYVPDGTKQVEEITARLELSVHKIILFSRRGRNFHATQG